MNHLTTDQLVAYHLDEISNNEKVLIENHLMECPGCQEEANLIGVLQGEWMNPSGIEPPNDFLNGIMLSIDQPEVMANKSNNVVKRNQSMKHRFIHLVIAAAATFLFFQFQLTKHIVDSNEYMVQTIEKTSVLIEKGGKISISFSKFWKGDKS